MCEHCPGREADGATQRALEKRRVGNGDLRNWIRSSVQIIHLYTDFQKQRIIICLEVQELGSA